MSDATSRKRSRAACLSCQSRKRKCSGDQPCTTCAQMGAGADCHYSTAPRKRRIRPSSAYGATLPSLNEPQRVTVPDRLSDSVPPSGNVASGSATSPNAFNRADDSRGVSHSLEANSGAAFVRKLGLRIDPARAPRLHLFAWNIGERVVANPVVMPTDSTPMPTAITMLFAHEVMHRLANTFFEKVDPCYPFLERGDIMSRIAKRWEQSDPRYGLEQPCDAVFYGIAAFGHLFSCREILRLEHISILAAHKILQKSVLGSEVPSIDMITGWVLRAAYLRMTASPHAAWMASCTLMHLIEAAGLHLEPPSSETSASLQSTSNQPQTTAQTSIETSNSLGTRQRLFGMARHLNIWTSFDLGRSRVVLHGTTTQIIPVSTSTAMSTPSNQETTRASLFHLLPLSESLDPTTSSHQSLQDLEASLTCVLDLHYSEPSLILVQSNLALCIYRRIRALNAHALLPAHLDPVLDLAGRGLRAARSMAAATCPWHQVANVPFQVVCTLLAIDSRPALALLPEAMETLREVLGVYDTAVMREAYSTAYLLVALHQRRKEDDTRALAEVLRNNAAAAQQQNQNQYQQQLSEGDVSKREDDASTLSQGQSQICDLGMQQETMPVDEEFSWLGDLVIDIPSLQNFDIDQFLMTDVPWPLPEMGI